ncbi:MAG: DUF3011 domain-containing protein [Rudaea sp.]
MMSIRIFAGVSLLVALCSLPAQTVHAQRHGYGYDQDRGQVVDCKSESYRRAYCRVQWRDARLVGQISSTPCRRGQNWGFSRGTIWVDGGCAGRFAEVGGGYQGQSGWNPPSGWNHRFEISCSSHNYEYNFCAADLGRGGHARLRRQTSGSPCVEGRTFGSNRAGVWVVQGCAGIFTIDRRWR